MEEDPKVKYQQIENYGLIGNLHTTALISLDGSIDYMPFTRYDSPTIFAKLLDAEKGGSFSVNAIVLLLPVKDYPASERGRFRRSLPPRRHRREGRDPAHHPRAGRERRPGLRV